MDRPIDKTTQTQMSYSYLALGDSYTIGEQVAIKDNFPNQLVTQLNEKGIAFGEPQIIAKTGWTTDELQAAINTAELKKKYDLVTLLIGVNNEYRGQKVDEYIPVFESLLKQAIRLAGDDTDRVIVLSIPDWGVTPFANGRDRQRIAREIDEYNAANERVSKKYGIHYINVTPGTREAATDNSLLAPDGLHPSAREYARWSKKILDYVQEKF
jgi:lysophospholipase L1-like esterase